MAGKYNNFQSQTSIKAGEEERQKARELILEKAKRKYEAEEAKIEKAKRAGEGTWMLDSLSKRLDNEKKALEKAKKKKKKEKKKKKKKEKKRKKSNVSSSSSSSDDDEPKWVVKGEEETQKLPMAPQKGPQLQRESWMEAPLDFLPLTSRQEIRDEVNQEKAELKKEANKMLEPGQHVRELNPYWKNGGTGLPPEKKDVASSYPSERENFDRNSSRQKFARPRDDGSDDDYISLRGSDKNMDRKFVPPRDNDQNDYSRRRDSDHKCRVFAKPSDDKSDNYSRQRNSDSGRSKFARPRDDDYDDDVSEQRNGRGSESRKFTRPRGDDDDRDSDVRRRSFSKRSPDRGDRDVPRWKKKSHQDERRRDRNDRKERRKRRSRSGSKSSSGSEERRNRLSSRGFARPRRSSSDESLGMKSRTRDSPGRQGKEQPRWKKKTAGDRLDKGGDGRHEGRRRSRSSSSSSGSDSENESVTSDKETEAGKMTSEKVLTEEELNALAAKILRAEIMGEDDLVAELKSKLESARAQREASKAGTNHAPDFAAKRREDLLQRNREGKRKAGGEEEEDDDNVVVLSRTNKAGMVRPVLGEATERWGGKAGGKKRKKNATTHDMSGMRTIYFDNDDKFDLKSLVEQEKAGTAEDQNSMFARLAGRSVDKDLDVDDMFVSRAAKQQDDEKIYSREKAAAVFEHKKLTSAMEKCQRCLKQAPKHLIVALGTKSYLCLPPHRSLTEGHCLIVPMAHSASVTSVDEDVWQEMQIFRKSLVQMFAEQDQDVVVMETVMHLKHFPHTALECIPLEKELGDMAPIYFKKAIQEAGPEWSDNKKLQDLRGKDVRRVIPKGFPYFSVDFGADSGYATVIEDESSFPAYFGREIVGGMLDADPSLWRKPHKQSFEDQRKKVLQFEKWWKPYDWTQEVSNAT